MSHPEIVVDFESHQDMMNGMSITQVNDVADIILRINALDDKSFALLRAVLTDTFRGFVRETVPDRRF